MADTHINAFEMDVQEKLAAVQAAQAEYQAAVDRLADKRKELGLEVPAPAPAEPEQPKAAPAEPEKKSKLSLGKK